MNRIKIDYSILILGIIITIISEVVTFPLTVKYGTVLLLLILGLYFVFGVFRHSLMETDTKVKIGRTISSVLLALTCAILALFQSVRTSEVVLIIEIVSVLNALFAIYTTFWKIGERLAFKHYLLFSFLIGISAFA